MSDTRKNATRALQAMGDLSWAGEYACHVQAVIDALGIEIDLADTHREASMALALQLEVVKDVNRGYRLENEELQKTLSDIVAERQG